MDLNDPHVRALAWLLDAPDLLDAEAPQWRGKVATLPPIDAATRDWLTAQDRAPDELYAFLGLQPFTRLGRYSEKLMAYYLRHRGMLAAHGVQVRVDKGDTVGEFDFLVHGEGGALLHWEFATKLYLLEPNGGGRQADYFVGPNLADTLGAKIHKIMDRQLSLSSHPAAQAHLPAPVRAAQALVKGWLFYQRGMAPLQPPGISPAHCRGFWCTLDEFDDLPAEQAVMLPRLGWLAPAKLSSAAVPERKSLRGMLEVHFASAGLPVLIALLAERGCCMVETERGFVVSDNWRAQAASMRKLP